MNIRIKVAPAVAADITDADSHLVAEMRSLLMAFWHRGRRCAVQWTSAELARRSGLSPARASASLAMLARRGLTIATHFGANAVAYELTAHGVAALLSQMPRNGGDA